MPPYEHTSVLAAPAIDLLKPRAGGSYIDATVGGGGHAQRILEASAPSGRLLGIDADPAAIDAARRRLAQSGDRITLVRGYFDNLEEIALAAGYRSADGILFDLGVSSPELETAERGFSFQYDGPLDMRLGPDAEQTAADLVNSLPEGDLTRIFFEYGEERYARRVARRIVAERIQEPLRTTRRLAELVTTAKPAGRENIHPATRVFQALRIAVNDELGRLRRALPQAVRILNSGGRLAVISFHSLEDRIVKQFFRAEAAGCVCPPGLPVCVCGHTPAVRILTAKPVVPDAAEVEVNPRARSAKLRAIEKLAHRGTTSGVCDTPRQNVELT